MATPNDPATPRRMLKGELRAARGGAGLTREDAARALDWSLSKLVRIETGDQGVSVTDLRAMLKLYAVTDERRVTELADLARGSRRQSWWSGYRDIISRQFGQLLSLEGSAAQIRTFHPMLVPALLHTDEYAFELLSVRMPKERADKLVKLRMERQERLLGRLEPAEMVFVFGEEALIRAIGHAGVMERQLRHLLGIASNTAVSIRIVPLSAGAHPGLSGSFILLRLHETREDLLFLEGAGGDLVNRDDRAMIDPFLEHFHTLTSLALSDNETSSLISKKIEALSRA